MNILLINHYAGSPSHGMEYRPFYMARSWVELGHRVTIVAASRSHVRTVPPTLRGNYTRESIEGVDYIWLKTPSYEGNGPRRALNLFAFVGQLLGHGARLAREVEPDAVIASSTYPLDMIAARRIARRAEARLVFEVHDLWPLSPIELGGMSPRHPFIRLMQWAEDYAYRRADRVVSMLPNAAGHMEAHGMAPEKFRYVPNGFVASEWQEGRTPIPSDHRTILTSLRERGLFLVGYCGAHGLANALESLVEAGSLLRDHRVALVLVGQGPEKATLQRKAKQARLTDVHFLPPVPKVSIPALLDLLDALFIGLKRTPIFRFGISPNKLIDYMMAGKPIIQAIEAGNDLVAENGCGFSIPPEDPRAIAEAALRLLALSPSEREAMGRKGREYVMAHHDYRVLARQFLEALR